MSLFQQLFNATLLGIVLGLLAVRSGSLWPGVLLHVINNSLAVVLSRVTEGQVGGQIVTWLYRKPAEGLYHRPVILVGGLISAGLLYLLVRGDPPLEKEAEPYASAAEA
jgi:sodium transport system permease protein